MDENLLRHRCKKDEVMKQEYYFQQMNREEKQVYRAMYDGFTALAPEFPVLRLEGKELAEIFFRLRLDHPSIFYVSSFTYRFFDQADSVHLIPEYLFEKKKIKEHQKALEGRITRLLRPMQELTPEEQEKSIHDFILENVTYDKLQKQYSHEIIGPLQHGIGVCEGIAKTVKLFCDRLGIDCLIAVSEADPEHGVRYRHAWNLVKIGGDWMHLDVTFDNSLKRYGTKRYDYYNLDDRQLFRDHQPLIAPVPACTKKDAFYYRVNRLSLTKTEEVGKRLKAVLRKKKPCFVFHWRGGAWNRSILEEILREAEAQAAAKDKHVWLSVNYQQSVVQINFTDQPAREEILTEEANEGEEKA